MSGTKTTKLNSYPEDKAIRAGAFSLLPENPSLPLLVSQPFKNFAQFSWREGFKNGAPIYQKVELTNNTINILEGTEFSIGLKTLDPSNVNDPNSTEFISYKWKKDGALIYDLNGLNGGNGTNEFYVNQRQSRTNLTGKYTCEVSNLYGTVESDPVTINVIDPLKHPKLYKNLILNGDGDGGLNGWQGDSDIRVTPFVKNFGLTQNFGSYRLGGIQVFKASYSEGVTDRVDNSPLDFYFCINNHYSLFANVYYKLFNNDPNFRLTNVKGVSPVADDGDRWVASGIPSQIVPNEDFTRSEFAAFYPGPQLLDTYNANNQVTGLVDELRNYTATYFTRDKLKFEKYGGKSQAVLTQVVDLTDVADLVDGNTYGVKYLTSQFFAYVGCGITDYKIKVQTTEGEKILNYYIGDSEDVYHHIIGDVQVDPNARTLVYESDLFNINSRYRLLPNTPIEITPVVYDTTSITLDYINEAGDILKSETIDGPDATDVWAIKEKVFFPLTLWGIYEFLIPTNNDITVFGQKYTDSNAVKPFFDTARNRSQGILGLGPLSDVSDRIRDVNAKFLLRKFDYRTGAAYPADYWYTSSALKGKTNARAMNDFGAAAMFGVGRDIIVPYKTRSVKITVTFTHTSEIIKDNNPELKGWKSQEIYSDEFGQSTNISRRIAEYGYPRCGITKMKFILAVNNLSVSSRYATYSIPPPRYTTLGTMKALYTVPNAYNSADPAKTSFTYYIPTPIGLPNPPQPPNVFVSAKTQQEYLNSLGRDFINLPLISQVDQGLVDPMGSNEQIQDQEDIDHGNGDYDGITGNEF